MKSILSGRNQLILAVAALAASYGFLSLAIDSGNNWEYAATLFLLVWGMIQMIRAIKKWFRKK